MSRTQECGVIGGLSFAVWQRVFFQVSKVQPGVAVVYCARVPITQMMVYLYKRVLGVGDKNNSCAAFQA